MSNFFVISLVLILSGLLIFLRETGPLLKYKACMFCSIGTSYLFGNLEENIGADFFFLINIGLSILMLVMLVRERTESIGE